ncbi:MAG: GNAT family N-acetyltransferase [Candidatus Zixiibacteriota bacterium]
MSEVRVLKDEEFPEMIRICAEAYPSMGMVTPEDKRQWEQKFRSSRRDPTWTPYGLFRGGQLVGVWRNFDFTLNVRGNLISAGGLGMVAVHLAHKKEHVAREIVETFLAHYYERGDAMTTLWPFRIDFYHKMGFGLGGRRYQYRVRPESLPKGRGKEHVRFLGEADIPALNECYNRIVEKQTGMILHNEGRWHNRFEFWEKLRSVGCEIDGRLEGYLIYSFKTPDNPVSFMDAELVVNELIYHTPKALSELLAFLRSQLDQVSLITLEVSEDEFYFLMSNPTIASGDRMAPTYHESHVAGLGIMYRVMDLKRLFDGLRQPSFADDQITIEIDLSDTFLPQNDGPRVVRFENGVGKLIDRSAADVKVSLDVAEFSSLLMGAVGFRNLHTYSLARISDLGFIDRIDRLFAYSQRPSCVTAF